MGGGGGGGGGVCVCVCVCGGGGGGDIGLTQCVDPCWPREENDFTLMMTSSNGKFFRVTGHLCGEFTGHRRIPHTNPVTRRFDVFFDLRLNKRLSKQSWGWSFETSSRPLWRHCNVSEKNLCHH